MSDIVTLLLEADNEKSENFAAAQAELVERGPIELITDLIAHLQDDTNSERLLFLMITLITNSFKRTISISVPKYSVATSIIDPAMAHTLFQIALNFFPHSYEPLRAAAANLFMEVASAEMQLFPELSLIDQLTERLCSENTSNVISATECFTVILENFVIEPQARSQIFQVIFQLVEGIEANTRVYTDSVSVLHHVIAMLVNISSSIFEELDAQESCLFMNHVVSHVIDPSLKEVVYQFIGSVAQENFSSILEFIPQVFQQSVTDILSETETQRNKLAATYLWEEIFSIEGLTEEEFDALSEVAENIIPVLIQEMTHDTVDEPSETNWDPPDAAFSALLCISQNYLQILLPFVVDQLQIENEESIGVRIASSRCLLLLSHYTKEFPDYYTSILTKICSYLGDECINVIYYCLRSLSNIIINSSSSNDFIELLPNIIEMCQNETLCNPALNCIYGVVHKSDFTVYGIISSLEQLYETIQLNNLPLLTSCFDFVYLPQTPVEAALDVLGFLINVMKQCDETFASIVCRMFPPLFNKCSDIPTDMYNDAFAILALWMDNDLFYAMPAVCSLAYNNPAFIKQSLSTICPYLLENLGSDDPDRIIQAINAWWIIYVCIEDVEEWSEQVFTLTAAKANPQTPISQQIAIFHAFFVITKHIKKGEDVTYVLTALENYKQLEILAELEMRDVESFQQLCMTFFDLILEIAKLGGISFAITYVYNFLPLKSPVIVARNQLLKLAHIFQSCDHSSFPHAANIAERIYALVNANQTRI